MTRQELIDSLEIDDVIWVGSTILKVTGFRLKDIETTTLNQGSSLYTMHGVSYNYLNRTLKEVRRATDIERALYE